MKKILILLACFTSICFQKPSKVGRHQLTLQEAESILGEQTILVNRENTSDSLVTTTKSTFSGKNKDVPTDKKGNLYFMFETFKRDEKAIETYHTFFESNKRFTGFEQFLNIGDEAFFHTDNSNFCLIIVRKGNKLARFKVNKLTTKTSVSALKTVSKSLIDRV